MLLATFSFCLIQCAFLCYALPQTTPIPSQQRQDPPSADLPCLSLMSAAEQGVYIFTASEVFDCIGKVPFNAAVASRFLDYYNDTLQFQSTLAFLKSPPEGYQQPSIDVMKDLEAIRVNISSGIYKSQYAFESQVQLLISRIHDSHVTLDAGVLSPFRFTSPYSLVSISQDGVREPKVYLKEDLIAAAKEGYTAYPVEKINDLSTIEYLRSLVAPNSDGYLEPHADWNSLMNSPANDIQGYPSISQRLSLYPGDDLKFQFENGTSLETIWLAMYTETSPTGPLTTPGDFFNYFVLGLVPAGFDPENPTPWWPAEYNISTEYEETQLPDEPAFNCSSSRGALENWCNATNGQVQAYPNDPTVVQKDLSIAGAGAITGYVLHDMSTGVLSIPSFYQDGLSVKNFFNAIDEFIGNATNKSTKRVVIDLQQNSGGLVLLALTTFQQFFPTLQPYTGSRIRSHEFADILGNAYTEWWHSLDPESDDFQDTAATEWVAVNRINAMTGQNFKSWTEYFGPVMDRNDQFSHKQLYNLSDEVFDYDMFGWRYRPWVNSSYVADSPAWAPDEIVLLTDGLCSSACALFVELMTGVAGVRTITVGGLPQRGPMQTASGNRGAAVYTSNRLDYDIANVETLINNPVAYARLPQRNDTGIFTNYASINIRDQMRANDTIPVQFSYEASDCRIYYTFQNYYNMTQLWRDAAIATWDDTTRCVADSTNYSKRMSTERKSPPKAVVNVPAPYDYLDSQHISPLDISLNTNAGLVDGRRPLNFNIYDQCENNNDCAVGLICILKATSCRADDDGREIPICLQTCSTVQGPIFGCKAITSRLPQSTSQRPIGKRASGTQKFPGSTEIRPPPQSPKSRHFGLPPKTSTNTVSENVYNGYIEPALKIKTSDYVKNSGCPK